MIIIFRLQYYEIRKSEKTFCWCLLFHRSSPTDVRVTDRRLKNPNCPSRALTNNDATARRNHSQCWCVCVYVPTVFVVLRIFMEKK